MTGARRLILHAGFPKTGSSAIQSWLAKNAGELARHGIAYRNFQEHAADDEISSGNGKALIEVLRAKAPLFGNVSRTFEQAFIPAYFGDSDVAIMSGEGLASASQQRLEWFKGACAERQIVVASVIVYCRSVYGHCYSAYQQCVKRKGETGTLQEFAAGYVNPQCNYIWPWHALFRSVLKPRLYDVVRGDLVSDFARAAGIDHLGLNTRQGSVNRSLTFRELELLRHLNAYHKGVLSGKLSDALIYANPSKESDYRFDSAIAEDLERRFGADVRKVNEVFFPVGPDRLEVARPPNARPRESTPQEHSIDLDPMIEIVLKTLGEGAAEAREQERRLRSRLSMALAKIAVNTGKWDVAAKNLQRAVKIEPRNDEAIGQLSDVYAQLGDHDGAEGLRRREKRLHRRAAESGEPPVNAAVVENEAMSELNRGNPADGEVRRESRRPERDEPGDAGVRATGGQEDPRGAARKDARERLARIRNRLQEIAEERVRLVDERTRLLGERKEGHGSK